VDPAVQVDNEILSALTPALDGQVFGTKTSSANRSILCTVGMRRRKLEDG